MKVSKTRIKSLIDKGYSKKEIAEKLGITEVLLNYYLTQYNLLENYCTKKDTLQQSKYTNYMRQGFSIKEISERLNISVYSILAELLSY